MPRHRRGPRLPARRASRRRSRAPGHLVPRRPRANCRCRCSRMHEDHVGGLPYFLREVDVPRIIGTKLTLGLVQSKLAEHKLADRTELVEVRPEDGPVEEAAVPPEPCAWRLDTRQRRRRRRGGGQRILHTSDYKLDHTPTDGFKTDVGRLAELGQPRRGISCSRFHECRRADLATPGRRGLSGRRFMIIPARGPHPVASFASNVHRTQQAGGRRRPQSGRVRRRTVDAEEPQYRARSATWRPRRCARRPDELDVATTRPRGHPLHGQPG